MSDTPDFSNVQSGSSSTATKIYVVKSGDSLSKIAKAEYGDGQCLEPHLRGEQGHPQGPEQDLPRARSSRFPRSEPSRKLP